MASKRNAKKDIEYITYTIVHDCMAHLEVDNDKTHDNVIKIISNTIQFRNELIHKINHQKKGKRAEVRAYYREIYQSLFKSADSAFNELSKAIKGK
jgi:hypothetical protein